MNEFKFFSINKVSDWLDGMPLNMQITDQGISLEQTEKYGMDRTISLNELNSGTFYDFALGKDSKLYLLDQDGSLSIYDYQNGHVEKLYHAGHGLYSGRAMLTAFGETVMIADPLGESKISAYSSSNGQSVWQLDQWNDQPLFPLAIAADFQNDTYVLAPVTVRRNERDEWMVPESTQIAMLRINRYGHIAQVIVNDAMRMLHSSTVSELIGAYFIAVSPKQHVCVLDANRSQWFNITEGGTQFSVQSLEDAIPFSGCCIDSRHKLYIGSRREVSLKGEDDRFIRTYNASGEFVANVLSFRGKTDKILIDEKNKMYVFDREAAMLTILEPKPRTKELRETGQLQGIYLTRRFDSGEDQTKWHKLLLDAQIPDETQMRVSCFASDRSDFIWKGHTIDIDTFIHSREIDWNDKLDHLRNRWSTPIINPKDALIFEAEGRYLWIRIEFIGSEQKSPTLRRMRVYYPRSSYLAYLPGIYREDPKSADFLERFLSLFESFFGEIDERIAGISRIFDPQSVSGPFLKWLGSWLAIAADDTWSDEQLRQLIMLAPQIYRQRGTKQSIEMMIEIFSGEKPLIVEYFQYKHLRANSDYNPIITELYGSNPYQFSVLMKSDQVRNDKQRSMIEKILDEQKPAFTEAKLVILQPWIYLDMHTYLGVNTFLSEPTLMKLDQQSAMPYNTVLVDVDMDNRLDIHTRLELDSEIE